jgi:hypothetical protein
VTVPLDLAGWQVDCWDLAEGRPDRATVRHENGRTVLGQPEFPGDALYVFHR